MNRMATVDYYRILGVSPWATESDIRQAYRLLSKQYHPDISTLAPEVALEKFKLINEAYATLTNPAGRSRYDQSLGFARTALVHQPSRTPPQSKTRKPTTQPEPTERPLSATELFALFILGIAFVASLALVAFVGWLRG